MVYLICFSQSFKHARHYIGWTENLSRRLKHHKAGRGSSLLAAVSKAGIQFDVTRTWPGADRNFERKLKNRKKAQNLCPRCSPARKQASTGVAT